MKSIRGGKIHWTPRFPDLTPLDFYLGRHAKEEVYKENINNTVQLKEKILQVFEELKNDNTLQSVQLSLIRRA